MSSNTKNKLTERTSSSNSSEERIVIEEDWSQFCSNALNDPSSKTNLNATTTIHISKDLQIELKCVESLTPLDMIDLYHGTNDVTGQKIWMGAYFFIYLFVMPFLNDNENNNNNHNDSHGDIHDEYCTTLSYNMILHLRQKLFHNKNIIELGAGTGFSGIALLLGGNETEEEGLNHQQTKEQTIENLNCRHDNTTSLTTVKPSLLVLTDSHEETLEICKYNCKLNLNLVSSLMMNNDSHSHTATKLGVQEKDIHSTSTATTTTTTLPQNHNHSRLFKENTNYQIWNMEWGEYSKQQRNHDNNETKITSSSQNILFDTCYATDVLYDLSSLPLLFETAYHLLNHDKEGYFILSHIPRASIPCTKQSCSNDDALKTVNSDIYVHDGDDDDDDSTIYRLGTTNELECLIFEEAAKWSFESIPVHSLFQDNDDDNNNDNKNDEIHYCHNDYNNKYQHIIRPRHLYNIMSSQKYDTPYQNKQMISLDEMESVGAGIFIFRKKNAKSE